MVFHPTIRSLYRESTNHQKHTQRAQFGIVYSLMHWEKNKNNGGCSDSIRIAKMMVGLPKMFSRRSLSNSHILQAITKTEKSEIWSAKIVITISIVQGVSEFHRNVWCPLDVRPEQRAYLILSGEAAIARIGAKVFANTLTITSTRQATENDGCDEKLLTAESNAGIVHSQG